MLTCLLCKNHNFYGFYDYEKHEFISKFKQYCSRVCKYTHMNIINNTDNCIGCGNTQFYFSKTLDKNNKWISKYGDFCAMGCAMSSTTSPLISFKDNIQNNTLKCIKCNKKKIYGILYKDNTFEIDHNNMCDIICNTF
jgi:ferredoxin